MKKDLKIILNNAELYALLLAGGRYAYGRRSYAVDEMCSIVKKFAGHLRHGELEVLYRDLKEAQAQAEKYGQRECDAQSLAELEKWFEKMMAKDHD